jgi:hypothetical protein
LLYTTFIRRKKEYISVWFSLTCKEIQENQAIAWFFKSKEKNLQTKETLVFLTSSVNRVVEKADNQRKTREKTKLPETRF